MDDNFKCIYRILTAFEKSLDLPEFDIADISAKTLGVSETRRVAGGGARLHQADGNSTGQRARVRGNDRKTADRVEASCQAIFDNSKTERNGGNNRRNER